MAEGDRREDVLQCRALGERALRPDGWVIRLKKSDETYEIYTRWGPLGSL